MAIVHYISFGTLFGVSLESPHLSVCFCVFLPQNLGRWQEPTNSSLSIYEWRFNGENTMRWWGHSNPTLCKRVCLNLWTHRQQAHKNFGRKHSHLSHLVEYPLPIFYAQYLMSQHFDTFDYRPEVRCVQHERVSQYGGDAGRGSYRDARITGVPETLA